MNDLFNTLIIASIFFILGAVVVGVVWYMQGMSKRLRSESKTAEPEDPNLEEIARLMRHLQTQELVVEVDSKDFNWFHELSPLQQRRITFTSNVLAKWISQPAPDPTQPEQPPVEPFEIPTEKIETMVSKPDYIPPFAPEPQPELKPVSTDLPDMMGVMLNPNRPSAPAFKSIAMQVNEILQAQIAGTPLDSRGITLNDTPDHGVMVTLEGHQYKGVMEVPDEEVRKAIRAAVKEWEMRK